jgi:hypothetical protein
VRLRASTLDRLNLGLLSGKSILKRVVESNEKMNDMREQLRSLIHTHPSREARPEAEGGWKWNYISKSELEAT